MRKSVITTPLRLALALGALPAVLACQEGLEPVPFQGVSGTVRFLGQPPDSTEWVRLAVYRAIPSSTAGLIGFVAFSDTLSLADDSIHYVLPLDPGTYAWIPVVWKRAGVPLAVTSLRVMGWHSGAETPFAPPRAFIIAADRETAGIDIMADFATLLSAEEALARVSGGT